MDNGNYAVITVEDDGCGIEEKNLSKIFDPFFSTKEKRNGTGLGLSIVEKLVKEHNGTISLKSEVGKGTMFSIFFPIFQESTVPFNQSDQCARPMDFTKTRILLVDDNIDLAQIAKMRLEQFGHEVDVFLNSRKALEAYKTNINRYDIVITDMNMPDMTGEELSIEVLKLNNKARIIVNSGYLEEKSITKLGKMGIDKVFTKPLKFVELDNYIRTLMMNEFASEKEALRVEIEACEKIYRWRN
jgi:CheY-like chemotaxis protein